MDKISISKLTVNACHGVLPEEKINPQRFVVSADMFFDSNKSEVWVSDKIAKTTHYGHVMKLINTFLLENCFNLIETAADKLAKKILASFPLIDEICLTIEKPDAPVKLPFENVSVTVKRSWRTVCLSFGSNVGDREKCLKAAVTQLESDEYIKLCKLSSVIETDPFECSLTDKFLNMCGVFKTLHTPVELLKTTQDVERKLGRTEKGNLSARTIDIDILTYENEVFSASTDFGELIIPHKEMHRRAFVLAPLAEIAPSLVHPALNKTVLELLKSLD